MPRLRAVASPFEGKDTTFSLYLQIKTGIFIIFATDLGKNNENKIHTALSALPRNGSMPKSDGRPDGHPRGRYHPAEICPETDHRKA
jgi:hypothetical protein